MTRPNNITDQKVIKQSANPKNKGFNVRKQKEDDLLIITNHIKPLFVLK